MPVSPKLFVSFSSKDKRHVRNLFHRLKSQNLDLWDYSDRDEEILWGRNIPEALREQIDASDFFVPVLTMSSTNPEHGRYTSLECAHAIDQGWKTQGRILPLEFKHEPPQELSGVFDGLREMIRFRVDPNDEHEFEQMIAKICKHLEVPYCPPFQGHTRLPFSQRFQREMDIENPEISRNQELMLIIDRFLREYEAGNYQAAEESVDYFLLTCRYRLRDYNPYYGRIVKGSCQIHLGKLAEAEETFLIASAHPRRDENSHGGLGQVYFRQQRWAEACRAFERALEICPHDLNQELLFNKLGSQIMAGEESFDVAFLDNFNVDELDADESRAFANMNGIAHFRTGNYVRAATILDAVPGPDATTATYLFQALKCQGRDEEGLQQLEAMAPTLDDPDVYHLLAHAYWHARKDERAVRVYREKLLVMKSHSRQYWIEYAQVVRHYDRQEMIRACSRILDRESFPLPRDKADFFYEGFANHLLGNRSRAMYDFERSGNFSPKYYDQISD